MTMKMNQNRLRPKPPTSVNSVAEDSPTKYSPGKSLSFKMTGDRSQAQDFAQRLKADWQQSVVGIIECGR
jgi:hypothetical protein